MTLYNLALLKANLGESAEALGLLDESIDACEELAEENFDAFGPLLSEAYCSLALTLDRLVFRDSAVVTWRCC